MRNLKLILSYDGSDFHGWQTQPGFRTVQETLETALLKLTGEQVRVNASGRTDTGVHAVGQVVNFHTDTQIGADVLAKAINAHLPEDVSVREAAEVPQSFDANRDAKRKLYRYVIHDGAVPDLFLRRYCCHIKRRLDAAAMGRRGGPAWPTRFPQFRDRLAHRELSVRTITHLTVNRFGDWVWLDVEADGFLYKMVRAIGGTLMNVGRGYWPESQVAVILHAEDRTQAGPTAPCAGFVSDARHL